MKLVGAAVVKSAPPNVRNQNSSKFGDGLRMEVRVMSGRHDQLGLCTGETAAPIANDAIRAIDSTSLTAISDDRMVFLAPERTERCSGAP